VPGSKLVYERNPDYVPRDEPASGMAGGKVVHIERAEWNIMPDPQTAMAALQAGEIDFFEIPPLDLIDILKADPNIKIQVLNELGNVGQLRLNHLHPPFDKVEARRAMLHLVNQEDYMRACIGNPDYYRICGSQFTCGSPMENDAGLEWMEGAPNVPLAKELLDKAGYDGRAVVILQPTDIPILSNAALVTAQLLRSADVNVELAASDWGGVGTRRAVKAPVEEGGWNIFHTWAGGNAQSSPINLSAPRRDRRERLVRLARGRPARGAARCLGGGADPRGAPGDRPAAPGERVSDRDPVHLRPVGQPGRLPHHALGHRRDPRGNPVLEHEEERVM
jgi:peptide/nickel transport system substrate-binding protein